VQSICNFDKIQDITLTPDKVLNFSYSSADIYGDVFAVKCICLTVA